MSTRRRLAAVALGALATTGLAVAPAGALVPAISFDPTSPVVGDEVTASGTNELCGDDFDYEIVFDNGKQDGTGSAEPDGSFTVTFTPDQAGVWTVQVYCGVDPDTVELEASVEVLAEAPTTTTTSTTSTTTAPSTTTTAAAQAVAAAPAFTG